MKRDPLSMEASRPVIGRLAWKVLKRARAAGARIVELEEIEQELWVAWSIARASFDTQRGVPFGAYFYRGALNHINAWFRQFETRDLAIFGLSLDDSADNLDDGGELHEVFADQNAMPADEGVGRTEHREQVYARLSPMTRRFLDILENPPPALYRELDAMRACFDFCRQSGRYASPAPSRVTTTVVSDLMGLDRAARNKVYRELKTLAGSV